MKSVLLFVIAAMACAQQPPLLILHKGAGSLGFYSAQGKLEQAVATGAHPHEMVISRDGRFAFTTDNGTMRIEEAGSGGNTVSIIDLVRRSRAGEISLGGFRRPHGIALDTRTANLLVTTELPDRLLVVDPAARRVVRDYDTKGRTSHMVALDADGGWAFVSNSGSGHVAAIELSSGAVELIPTGERPEGSVVAGEGKVLYVANREGNTITIIDTKRRKATGQIVTGKGPVRIAATPGGKLLVYALLHERAVEFADLRTRTVTGRVPIGGPAGLVSIALSADGKRAYTSAEDDDTVYVVSVEERKLLHKFRTAPGSHPDPVAEHPF